jgi:hypothetical protein|tara:strand:- start:5998 stop:6402 length:405 start_codon:yes stop_codon:yes gene_type:complete
MRDTLLTFLTTAITGTDFSVTQELPYNGDGAPLFLKNLKKVYVDQDQTSQDPLLDVLDASGQVVAETVTNTVTVVVDAKVLPSGYATLVSQIKSARLDPAITGFQQKSTDVSTEYNTDRLVTEFVFNFTKLIVN